jgi:hypothetical protein
LFDEPLQRFNVEPKYNFIGIILVRCLMNLYKGSAQN